MKPAIRSQWIFLTAAGLVSTMLLTGCSSSDTIQKPSLFGRNAREEAIRKQAEKDSFPTASQAGLSSRKQ
jgi:hypothetical protein